MNKKDIKESLNHIKPDEYLKSRLSAKLESTEPKAKRLLPKLTVSTAAICGLVLVLSISVGIGLKSFNNTTKVSLTQHYASESASVINSKIPSEVVENINNKTEDQGNYVQYSVPTIETQVHYHQVLLVNGKDIAPDNYVKFEEIKNYAELPLTAILEEFGATVKWQSDTEAVITLNGKSYMLNAEKCTLKEENSPINLLTPVFSPGTSEICDIPMYRTYGDDFIVDNYTLQGALNNLGFNYTVTVDYKTEIATIK